MQPPATASKRALFVSPEAPGLGQGGGALRSESLLNYLQRDYAVDVVPFQLKPHSNSLQARVMRNAARLLRGTPPLFDRYSGYEHQLPPGPYDVAVIEHFWCASYATALRPRARRLVLDLHNIESQLAERHAASIKGLARAAQQRFAAMYQALEKEWLPKFDTLLVTSETDRVRLRHPDVRVFPNAIPSIPEPQVAEEPAIAFSGNLEYHPNIEAVRWIARDLQPALEVRIPGIEWRLIGRNPHAIEPLLRGRPNITLTGPVDDAIAAIAQARVCVVPLLSGSGTRFKILEAWAAGRAVVSTTIGAEGLAAIPGQHLLIADTTEAFTSAIASLWNDPALRRRLGAAGRAHFEQHFTWEAAWRELDHQGAL